MINCLGSAVSERAALYHGDCVDIVRQLPDNSIDLAVYSPPFSGLYIYNDSICDMGNSDNDSEFFHHYGFLVEHLARVMRPGRLVYVHCKDLVYYRNQRGTAGLRDFQGELIRAHTAAGFDFASRVTIWRSPVREMTKTKAQGLLYKQLRADSTFTRAGLPEYFIVFRKWAKDGDEAVVAPVTHTHADFPLEQWQEWASPVWQDTRETDVLEVYRDNGDEKHICPLPLDLIKRAVILGSNPGEIVLDPFVGIGSVGYVAMQLGRKFVGCELKEAYFRRAAKHVGFAEASAGDLFVDAAD